MHDPQCKKDYFSFGIDNNCGCKKAGPLAICRCNGASYYSVTPSATPTACFDSIGIRMCVEALTKLPYACTDNFLNLGKQSFAERCKWSCGGCPDSPPVPSRAPTTVYPTATQRPLCYCQSRPYTYSYAIDTTPGWSSSLSSGSALEATKSCDKSMALLTGPFTSIGTLQDIVHKLTKKKSGGVPRGSDYADYMPGECCVCSLVNTMRDVFSCDCYCSRSLISLFQHVSTQLDTALTSEYPDNNVSVSDISLWLIFDNQCGSPCMF